MKSLKKQKGEIAVGIMFIFVVALAWHAAMQNAELNPPTATTATTTK